MFRSPAPESPVAANNEMVLLQALANLSPEDIEKRCQTYDKKNLENIITVLDETIELKKTIFDTFKYTVGYPDDEHTINGIQAYASGKIRKLEASLFGASDEEALSNLEFLATKYSTLATIELSLIAILSLFKNALNTRFPEPENSHPSP